MVPNAADVPMVSEIQNAIPKIVILAGYPIIVEFKILLSLLAIVFSVENESKSKFIITAIVPRISP